LNCSELVNVKVIEGVFSTDQKQDIVGKVTDALVEIEGENMRSVTWVVVEEVASGDWGIGGTPLHTPTSRLSPQGNPSHSSRLRPADDPPWAVRRAAGE
jgi:4-oxalocrotonate tautomerase